MNICITSHDMEPLNMCGIKRVSSILAKEWIKECNVCFMTFTPEDKQIREICGIPQYHFPEPNDILSEKNVEYFISFIKETETDIILHQHSNIDEFTELCIKVKELTNVKLVTVRHFAITHNNDTIRRAFFIKNKLDKSPLAYLKDVLFFIRFHMYKKRKNTEVEKRQLSFIIDNSDKFVLLSNNFVDEIKILLGRNEDINKKVCAIYNPLEICNQQLPQKKKRVLWCGRVEYGTKRVDRIIDVWKSIAPRHPDWELYIMGSGNIEHFKEITRKERIANIFFTGTCAPYEYYKEGSILCMTSSIEGWGMVLVEAQMFGCIPIAYNSYSSLQEIITDNINGYTIPAFDKRRFAERLEWLMEHDDERENLIVACQKSVKRFDARIIAQQWMEMFKGLISE